MHIYIYIYICIDVVILYTHLNQITLNSIVYFPLEANKLQVAKQRKTEPGDGPPPKAMPPRGTVAAQLGAACVKSGPMAKPKPSQAAVVLHGSIFILHSGKSILSTVFK